MPTDVFAEILSEVASRLRHDLKGGLITLRMGLEALPEEEELKPHLVERTEQLESLADKLVLLLRMGRLKPHPVRLTALCAELRQRLQERFPQLALEISCPPGDSKPALDSDALFVAMIELAENAVLGGAQTLAVEVALDEDALLWELCDDGGGMTVTAGAELTGLLVPLGSSFWGRSGLGLAIVDCCVRGHGGELSVQSGAKGKGLRIQMRLQR